MAFIARFSFDVPFGKKEELFRIEGRFRELQEKLGFPWERTAGKSSACASKRLGFAAHREPMGRGPRTFVLPHPASGPCCPITAPAHMLLGHLGVALLLGMRSIVASVDPTEAIDGYPIMTAPRCHRKGRRSARLERP